MRPVRWGITLGFAVLCAWFARMAVYQVDDAFIVYRYAANLARGEGFVFNSGERVEGVTCSLWTVLLAPFAAAGLPVGRTRRAGRSGRPGGQRGGVRLRARCRRR